MAASGSSVGGYSAAFLTAEQLERFQAVKIKICGNKTVDLDDFEKHGMHREANIEEASTAEAPLVQEDEVVVREDGPTASVRRIEDIAPELIEPFRQSSETVIPPPVLVPSVVQESIADAMESGGHTEGEHVNGHIEETPSILVVETAVEGSHEEKIPDAVAPGQFEDNPMEDALAQGEPAATASVDQFQEELEQEKNSEVKRAQLGVVPGWVTFLGSLPISTVVGPVCWLGRHNGIRALPSRKCRNSTQDKVLRYGSHLLKP
ncbi:hypothetical protein Taro_034570 [Colocasia esculenta]|uniref:Uncharacterized protein n=1 Tax=Colocasia esculenta TaxID=4460 RepID=A0A843VWR1_COLES|nr:hypothetical protein [Colocasia esculenta]